MESVDDDFRWLIVANDTPVFVELRAEQRRQGNLGEYQRFGLVLATYVEESLLGVPST